MLPAKIQDLKTDWIANASYYSEKLEKTHLIQAISLVNTMNFTNCETIVEVGSGGGRLANYLLPQLKHKCKYILVDFCEEMLNIANKRINDTFYNRDLIEIQMINENAENLTQIKSDSIDLYFSNLCLHLVPQPENMLKEAYRVLKKGSQVGFTVMGKRQNYTQISLFLDIMEKIGYIFPTSKRSSFHLGDQQKLINLIKDSGFIVDLCWTIMNAVDIFSVEEYYEQIYGLSSMRKPYETLNQEQKVELKKLLEEEFFKLKKNKMPLTAEYVIIIAHKP